MVTHKHSDFVSHLFSSLSQLLVLLHSFEMPFLLFFFRCYSLILLFKSIYNVFSSSIEFIAVNIQSVSLFFRFNKFKFEFYLIVSKCVISIILILLVLGHNMHTFCFIIIIVLINLFKAHANMQHNNNNNLRTYKGNT